MTDKDSFKKMIEELNKIVKANGYDSITKLELKNGAYITITYQFPGKA